MPEPVIIFRGFPSGVDRAATHPEMLKDLEVIADLNNDDLTQLRARLEAATGFLDPKKLATLVRQVISDEPRAAAIRRALLNLAPTDVVQLLESLYVRSKEEDFPLKDDQLKNLQNILPRLIVDVPALRRFEKADRLAHLTGQQMESFELICDLRPIFDDQRTGLEGMMPYTRLRLSVTGDDGLPRSFEAELTAQQVHELAEKAAKAKEKLVVLRSKVSDWLTEGLPDLSLTRAPQTESGNASG